MSTPASYDSWKSASPEDCRTRYARDEAAGEQARVDGWGRLSQSLTAAELKTWPGKWTYWSPSRNADHPELSVSVPGPNGERAHLYIDGARFRDLDELEAGLLRLLEWVRKANV